MVDNYKNAHYVIDFLFAEMTGSDWFGIINVQLAFFALLTGFIVNIASANAKTLAIFYVGSICFS
jgi:hypothetical protein